MEEDKYETTDVLIIGAGPSGLILSAELGVREKVKNIVLEKDAEIYPYPRAFTLPEHALRLIQGVGLYDKIFTEIGQPIEEGLFVGGTDANFHKKPFLKQYNGCGSASLGGLALKQPVLERCLHTLIHENEYSEIYTGCTVTSIREDDDWVYVDYEKDGVTKNAKARFLVGADGKVGYTRKKYLEPKGVIMENTLPWTMLAGSVNLNLKKPTPKTHPDFPLWSKGFTPDDVVDAFVDRRFMFKCNPKRPTVSCRVSRPEEDPIFWRFEIATFDDEDGDAVLDPSTVVDNVIMPHMERKGRDFGLKGKIVFPRDCIELITVNPYRYSARTCNRWFDGRTILVGDAAHVFPPFAGQGVNCGLMDSSGLAWRLSYLLSQSELALFKTHGKHLIFNVLTTWELERRKHVIYALKRTLRNGIWVVHNRFKAKLLQTIIWLQRLLPALRQKMDNLADRPIEYSHGPGMAFRKIDIDNMQTAERYSTITLPQIGVMETDGPRKDKVQLLDDVLFSHDKKGLMQLLILSPYPEALGFSVESIKSLLSRVSELSEGNVLGEEAVILRSPLKATSSPTDQLSNIKVRPATRDEFAASPLCEGRSDPLTYNERRIHQEFPYVLFLLVRKDRFVYAAVKKQAQLEEALKSIRITIENGVERKDDKTNGDNATNGPSTTNGHTTANGDTSKVTV